MKKMVSLLILALCSFCLSAQTIESVKFDWVNTIGGFNPNSPNSTASINDFVVNSSNEIIEIGSWKDSIDFDPGLGQLLYTSNLLTQANIGRTDGYVRKLDSNGQLLWVKVLQPLSQSEIGGYSGVYLTSQDEIIISGSAPGSLDLDLGMGIDTLGNGGGAFIQKMDPAGNHLWVKNYRNSLNNSDQITIRNLMIDDNDNIYAFGQFYGNPDFDPGPGVVNLSFTSGIGFSYIMKLDAGGNLIWVKGFRTTASTNPGSAIYHQINFGKLSSSNEIYLSGGFVGPIDFDPGPGNQILTTVPFISSQVYILKLDSNGQFSWVRRYQGFSYLYNDFLILDDQQNPVLGLFGLGGPGQPIDLDLGPAVYNSTEREGLVVRLDSAGNFLNQIETVDNGEYYRITDAIIDSSNNLYLTGFTDWQLNKHTDFDTGPSKLTSCSKSVIQKIDSSGDVQWVKSIGVDFGVGTVKLELDSEEDLYLLGRYSGTTDFDPGQGIYNRTSLASNESYLLKLNECVATMDTAIISVNSCGSYTPTGLCSIDSSGIYTLFYTAVGGCDSIVTINLNVTLLDTSVSVTNNTLMSNQTGVNYQWINCSSNSIILGATSQSYSPSSAGIYAVILTSAGCMDTSICSVVCPPTSATINVQSCSAYTSPSNLYTWSSSGTYVDTILNTNGCDSIITINLTVTSIDTTVNQFGFSFTANQTIGNYQWFDCVTNAPIVGATSQTFTPTSSGSYALALNSNGCLDTSGCYTTCVPNTGVLSVSSCNSYTSPSSNYTWTTSGSYTDTLINSFGCDSVITITLTINNDSFTNISATGCVSYLSPSGNHLWTLSGVYNDTLPSANGCDSIITINLNLINIVNSIVQNGNVLSSGFGSSYQWLRCNPYSILSGETNQTYAPTNNGSYAVVVDSSGCIDTTNCYQYVATNISEVENSLIAIFPNPVEKTCIIDLGKEYSNIEIRIKNLAGQVLSTTKRLNMANIQLEIELRPGIYFFEVIADDIRVTKKVLKL